MYSDPQTSTYLPPHPHSPMYIEAQCLNNFCSFALNDALCLYTTKSVSDKAHRLYSSFCCLRCLMTCTHTLTPCISLSLSIHIFLLHIHKIQYTVHIFDACTVFTCFGGTKSGKYLSFSLREAHSRCIYTTLNLWCT